MDAAVPDEQPGGVEVPALDQASVRPEVDDRATCWVCGAPVVERHCKILCPRCGFMRDCSDP